MPLRCAITKASGQGEQLVMDVCQWNPVTGAIAHNSVAEMMAILDESLKFADLRMEDMNLRMLEAYRLQDYFDPGTWQQVVCIMDILAGRQDAALVRQRWDSIKEENADLEAARLTAHEESISQGYVLQDWASSNGDNE